MKIRAILFLGFATLPAAQPPTKPEYIAVPLSDGSKAKGYLVSCPEDWNPKGLYIGGSVTLNCAEGAIALTALADPDAPYGAEIYPAGTLTVPPTMYPAAEPGTPEVTEQ